MMRTKRRLILVALFCVVAADAARATVTLQMRTAGFANSAGTPANGMRWGIVVDTKGDGFAFLKTPGQHLDSLTDVTRNGFLRVGGVLTDDYYFFNGYPTTRNQATFGSPPSGAGAGFMGDTGPLLTEVNGVAAGKQFGIIWWQTDGSAGASFGFFTNASMTIPQRGTFASSFSPALANLTPAQKTASFTLAAGNSPTIAVQQVAGLNLGSGTGAVSLGTQRVGASATATLSILNNGAGNLNLGSLSIDGIDGADFSVTQQPATPVLPGGHTTVVVSFTPSGAGARTATLHIPSDDGFQPLFDLNLSGIGDDVSTSPATYILSGKAMLNGAVNPNGKAATAYFQYGLTTNYGSTTIPVNAGSGSSSVPVSFNLNGLTPGAIYHYQLVLSNADGTFPGADQTFTTPEEVAGT